MREKKTTKPVAPRTGTVRLEEDTLHRLRVYAVSNRLGFQDALKLAVEEYLKKRGA
jgi:hypothetical protein